MLGIIIALNQEVNDLRKELNIVKEEKCGSCLCYFAKHNNNETFIIFSGVGKVNAAHATSILINKYNCDNVINIGSAGALNKKYGIGDVCLVTTTAYADVDATQFGYLPNQVPHEPQEFLPTLKLSKFIWKELIDSNKFLTRYNCYLSTSDSFIDKNNIKEFTFNKNTDLIDMEGAAISQICSKYEHVSYAIIKIVSDVQNKKTQSNKQWEVNSLLFKNIITTIVKGIVERNNE